MTGATQIAKGLSETGIAVVEPFFAAQEWKQIQLAFTVRRRLLRFKAAGVGAGKPSLDLETRRDETCWIEPSDSDLEFLQTKFSEVRVDLNQRLFLGLNDQEFHFSRYPKGAFYRRHSDRFKEDHRRVVSLIVYLNNEWDEAWGGQLRTYLGEPRDFFPLPNRAIFFMSDEVEHEVLPTYHERNSLTGWFRRS